MRVARTTETVRPVGHAGTVRLIARWPHAKPHSIHFPQHTAMRFAAPLVG